MNSLLILTVGTGTAGKHSNLAQGLINTIAQARPRLFWLVPSSASDSRSLADRLRELLRVHLPAVIASWTAYGRPRKLLAE